MKKTNFVKTILFFAVIVCFTLTGERNASAANYVNIPLQQFEEIDNVPYPDLTFFNLFSNKYRSYSEFTIDSFGQVKAFVKPGFGVTGQGSVWVSRDHLGQDIVANIMEVNSKGSSFSWFLESGTYYINYNWSYGDILVGAALLYEKAVTEEKEAVSSFSDYTPLEFGQTTKGFISCLTPNDYYSFVLEKKANVTIEYSFDAANNISSDIGYCTLYNSKKLQLADGTYKSTDKGALSYVYLLEPGRYYLKLNGMYGNTSLSVNPMYYDIKLSSENSLSWTDEPIEINIETSIDYSEILVLNQDVEDSLVDKKTLWTNENELNIKVVGQTFEVAENGIYSVRITDVYGNYAMEKIEVKNIDTKKPKIKGVKNKKAYKKEVTIQLSDDLSGIDFSKTTLNGKNVKSKFTVKEKGKYVLRVYDKIGNKKTITFYIDYTAPTSGIENKKTYKTSVTLKFKDDYSGIKKILIDNEEIDANTKNKRYFLSGEYEIEMWDNAGNYKKEVFYIE